MNPEKIRELLPEYIRGELSEADQTAVRRALDGSEDLRKEHDSLKGYFGLIGKAEQVRAPGDFVQRVNERIDRRPPLARLARALFMPFHLKIPLEVVGLGVTIAVVFVVLDPLETSRRDPRKPSQHKAPETVEVASPMDKEQSVEEKAEERVGKAPEERPAKQAKHKRSNRQLASGSSIKAQERAAGASRPAAAPEQEDMDMVQAVAPPPPSPSSEKRSPDASLSRLRAAPTTQAAKNETSLEDELKALNMLRGGARGDQGDATAVIPTLAMADMETPAESDDSQAGFAGSMTLSLGEERSADSDRQDFAKKELAEKAAPRRSRRARSIRPAEKAAPETERLDRLESVTGADVKRRVKKLGGQVVEESTGALRSLYLIEIDIDKLPALARELAALGRLSDSTSVGNVAGSNRVKFRLIVKGR